MDNYNKWQSFWNMDCLNLWLTETLTFPNPKNLATEELWDRFSPICNNIILLGCLSLKIILETVINILRERFGKPQLLISYHMVTLLKLAIVSSVHGMKKLRDLYDNNEINIQSLKATGIESFGNLLVPVDNSSYMMALKYIVMQEKEMLAVVFALEKWHQLSFGRHVIVRTDHKPCEAVTKKCLTGHKGSLKVCCLEVWPMT